MKPQICIGCDAEGAGWTCERCGAIRTLDAYTIRRVLAAKPNGRTYLAEATDGKRVVIKEWLARPGEVDVIDAFEREVRLLAGLRHPRLPRFMLHERRVDESGALRLFTVMEYLEGHTLEQLAARNELAPDQLLGFLRQGLDLLVYLQARAEPLVHRDLKPSNLLVSADGTLRLVDFGGRVAGATGFAPPEQTAGRVDNRTDPYALAMTVICLLTGAGPAEVVTDTGPVRNLRLRIEPRVAKVLRRMVARRPEARFPDAKAARGALAAQALLSPRAWVAVAATALLLAGGVVRARAGRKPVVPKATAAASADVRVLARWKGGLITSDDFQAELDRLPPILVDTYPDWRVDLVRSLAVQQQLEQVALARGLPGSDRFARLRALLSAATAKEETRRERFEALVAGTHQPELVSAAQLTELRPSRLAGVYQPWPYRPRALVVSLGPYVTLRGWQSADGTFELSWPEEPASSDDYTRTLPPLDWLYIDLVEPVLAGGNYVLHSPPSALVAAGGPQTWMALPPPPPEREVLAARYSVELLETRLASLAPEDVATAWERVREPVARCLMLAAWDSRIEHASVLFSVWVTDGRMRASVPDFNDVKAGRLHSNLALVRTDQGSSCGDVLARWRFPRDVSGSAVLIIRLDGSPWTDAEQ